MNLWVDGHGSWNRLFYFGLGCVGILYWDFEGLSYY